MSWFDQRENPKLKSAKKTLSKAPEGLWKKCSNCGEILQNSKLEENFSVCPYCNFHFRISAVERINQITDAGSFRPYYESLQTSDPLNFVDKKSYRARLDDAYVASGMHDGTIMGIGKIFGDSIALAVMNFSFMGGSMGVATGEKIASAFDLALEKKIPAVVVSCSGGARMQEGILSLMQMAKTSGTRQRLKHAGIPYISVLTDPTTGGCAASFSMLGDINLAEPNALIGFAGPRVIEQSIRQKLPEGFQRSEFLLDHGFIDRIVPRRDLKQELHFFLRMFSTLAITN